MKFHLFRKEIFVNIHNIDFVCKEYGGKGTRIALSEGNIVIVEESFEEVVAVIKKLVPPTE